MVTFLFQHKFMNLNLFSIGFCSTFLKSGFGSTFLKGG